jgi:hypothetical protein
MKSRGHPIFQANPDGSDQPAGSLVLQARCIPELRGSSPSDAPNWHARVIHMNGGSPNPAGPLGPNRLYRHMTGVSWVKFAVASAFHAFDRIIKISGLHSMGMPRPPYSFWRGAKPPAALGAASKRFRVTSSRRSPGRVHGGGLFRTGVLTEPLGGTPGGHEAAVEVEYLTGDPTGVWGNEESDRSCDVLRLTEAL